MTVASSGGSASLMTVASSGGSASLMTVASSGGSASHREGETTLGMQMNFEPLQKNNQEKWSGQISDWPDSLQATALRFNQIWSGMAGGGGGGQFWFNINRFMQSLLNLEDTCIYHSVGPYYTS